MNYTPLIETEGASFSHADEDVMRGATLDIDRTDVLDISLIAPRPLRNEARYRGLAMDMLNGVVRWRGEMIHMGRDERDMLAILLTRAGRFVSVSQLARQLGIEVSDAEREIDRRVAALREVLQAGGARCLPRKAEGVGYILWA